MNKAPVSRHRVQFQDCDPFGHLNNGRYIDYIMNARLQQVRETYGFDFFDHTKETGKGWVVGKTEIAYLSPVKYNEIIEIESHLLYTDNRRVIPEAIVLSEDRKKIHAFAKLTFIYVDVQSGRPTKHSKEINELLNGMLIVNNDNIEFDNRLQFAKALTKSVKVVA